MRICIRIIVILINTSAICTDVGFINAGKTLSPDEVDKINMPFFRGSNASYVKGFGLGLSIINRIVEMHNSTLKYSIEESGKNKFAISFKLKPMANREKV